MFGGVLKMDKIEKAYWTHEVSNLLGIGDSTLRKWCIELEKNGYIFIKGNKNSRAFTDHDLLALKYFKELTRDKNHTFEQACKAVVEKYSRKNENEGTTPVLEGNNRSVDVLDSLEKMVKELLDKTQKQEQFNKALVERLEKQERYIKESIDKRDQLLLESIRATQEQAAAQQKKSFLKRIFGK